MDLSASRFERLPSSSEARLIFNIVLLCPLLNNLLHFRNTCQVPGIIHTFTTWFTGTIQHVSISRVFVYLQPKTRAKSVPAGPSGWLKIKLTPTKHPQMLCCHYAYSSVILTGIIPLPVLQHLQIPVIAVNVRQGHIQLFERGIALSALSQINLDLFLVIHDQFLILKGPDTLQYRSTPITIPRTF
ncbi:hypothetical protein LENED_009178 [Lentinula edodes]|uniref:Uncharacterized protein n=1 Tax=Lentinula edodes TaxID=5353 RepID=A0A1Q3EJ14_LENED|nr:hypothetical protein LENED_009178 [Lentinula edodes]